MFNVCHASTYIKWFLGSTAAAIQSSIGLVQAGSLFAFCQSAAAGGAAFATITATSTGLATTAAVAGNAATLKELQDSEDREPSDAWKDGANFVPHPEVTFFLMQTYP